MNRSWKYSRLSYLILLCLLMQGALPYAQKTQHSDWTETASFDYGISADITYGTFQNVPVHLDVWKNQKATSAPTLVYIHGGGWVFGDKNGAINSFLPYVKRGWNIVNVEYRMAGTSRAPAAVEDVRCALRWVYRNAAEYHIDTKQIVVTGHSAGGHLALIAGMLPNGTDLDNQCPAGPDEPPIQVAAIVNWFGISDVNEILEGPDRRTYAVAWLGSQPDTEAIARRVSPLTYVRVGLPPIITIHGDHDPTVPYSQAISLRNALTRVGVPNQLVTIVNGGHGSFSDDQASYAFQKVWSFLDAHHIGEVPTASSTGGH